MNNILKLFTLICFINFTNYCKIYDASTLIDHVQKSITKAYNHDSKLTESILNIQGMSTAKVRHFLNNLCSLPEARYLEIGVYQGSTFISALYQNKLTDALAIDNWSEFGNNKAAFLTNTSLFLPKNSFRFYEGDSFMLDVQSLFNQQINIYFYDGDHSAESQEKAFTYFNDVFDNIFIAVVDDWNWENVQQGTKKAFQKLNYTILFEKVLPSYTIPDTENWWNGLYVAVIQKNK